MYVGAIFIAASVLLQFLLPGIFDSIAKIIMPSNVYISVINRNSTGYVTGLTREVSYAALFLFIGLLYSIFIKKNRVISFVWLGILFLTGKKAQPIFAIIAICIVLYSQTKNLKKHLKILCIECGKYVYFIKVYQNRSLCNCYNNGSYYEFYQYGYKSNIHMQMFES